jgi:hypothetical protein
MKSVVGGTRLLLSLLLLFAAAEANAAVNCASDQCNNWTTLCANIEACIKECGVEQKVAQQCYHMKKIDEGLCKKLYPACKSARCIQNCGVNQLVLCGYIDSCVSEGCVSASVAKSCFQLRYIDKAHCDRLYDKCDDQCAKCYIHASGCANIETCVKECGVPAEQAQNCMKTGTIDMARCKKVYPACK